MRHINISWLIFTISILLTACTSNQTASSPDGNLRLTFQLIDGAPMYTIMYRGDTIIRPSAMGFELKDSSPLKSNFKIINTIESNHNSEWQQPWGENKIVNDHHNQLKIELEETTPDARRMNIIFRLFDDGVAFRYEFPEQANLDEFVIADELTQFAIAQNPDTWWIEADFDSYEKLYRHTPLSDAKWVATPVTMKMNAQCYLAIHEANLTDYADMTLKQNTNGIYNAALTPWANGDKVRTQTPMHTPWRTIQVSTTAAGLIESNIIENLNEPSKIEDTSWIEPMKYIGIWWGMHLGTETWHTGPRHGATTANALKHIDFAASNNIQGVVVEGWNAGWENWGGEFAFDHTTPASDYDLEKVAAYAKEKGIQLIGHHETGGDIPSYEALMERAFELCRSLEIKAVKTGYAGGIYPRGEHHHGQFMVRHYRKVVETAARYGIMLDVHECIKPTGIRRTWPNMMTGEGVRGMEWNAWSEGNPPSHTVTLPFTRGLAGPYDYTPLTFDLLFRKSGERVKWNCDDISKTRTHTTLARQLAEFVILYSPLQMASDLPQNYENHPAFQFIRDYDIDTDETKILNGEPGQYITTARRSGSTWAIGSATNEEARRLTISLDFLEKETSYVAQIYRDAEDSQWQQNPETYIIETKEVNHGDMMDIHLAAGGGQAILIVKQ